MPVSRTLINVPAGGAITVQTDDYIEGKIYQIAIDYTGVGAGTTLVIQDAVNPIVYLQRVATNVDGVFAPRPGCQDNVGAAVFYDPAGAPEAVRGHFYSAQPVEFVVTAAGGAGTIEITIYYTDHK